MAELRIKFAGCGEWVDIMYQPGDGEPANTVTKYAVDYRQGSGYSEQSCPRHSKKMVLLTEEEIESLRGIIKRLAYDSDTGAHALPRGRGESVLKSRLENTRIFVWQAEKILNLAGGII